MKELRAQVKECLAGEGETLRSKSEGVKEHLELTFGLKKLKERVKEDMKSEGGTAKEHRARGGAPI